jgi:hypothetical protein
MASGLSHVSSWVTSGWVRSGFPVTVSYSLKAAWNMAAKLLFDREGPGAWLVVDIEREVADASGRGIDRR